MCVNSGVHHGCCGVIVEALVLSQAFIRDHHCIASLRDVQRAILLIRWFKGVRDRPARWTDKFVELKAATLSFAVCYSARLTTRDLREQYMDALAGCLGVSPRRARDVVREEQNF